MDMLDLYSDYLIFQNKNATATGLSDLKDGYLRDYVCRSLKKGWSPEQISGRMKYQKLTIYVCPETIYQYVYKSRNKELYHCLPYKQPKRYKRYSRKQQQCRFGGDMRLITERPDDVNLRTRF